MLRALLLGAEEGGEQPQIRSHAQRRNGLRGDCPVHVDEATNGEKAPRSHSRQRENQQGRRDEDLVGETHRAIPKLAQGAPSVTTLTPGNPLTSSISVFHHLFSVLVVAP